MPSFKRRTGVQGVGGEAIISAFTVATGPQQAALNGMKMAESR